MNYPTPSTGNVNCLRGCGRLNVIGCGKCRQCFDCGCRCKQCANCATRHSNREMCRVCGRCKKATADVPKGSLDRWARLRYKCTCRMRPKAIHMDPIPTSELLSRHSHFRLRRPIGLEIELSDVGDAHYVLRRVPFICQWVHDGSITQGGQELVVHPLVGQKLEEGITFLTQRFEQFGSRVDHSCGYHVHVGAQEFSAYELRRVVQLYHRFEDLFYSLVEDGRDRTKLVRGEPKTYCARWKWLEPWYTRLWQLQRAKDIRRFLIESMYPDWIGTRGRIDMRNARKHKYEKCRYVGLNLHTWFERGTVEYRHHEGTISREKLLYWALFCGWFTEIASALTDGQVKECTSVNQLLHGEWSTGTGMLRMPSDVAAWVHQTLEERQVERRATAKSSKTARV